MGVFHHCTTFDNIILHAKYVGKKFSNNPLAEMRSQRSLVHLMFPLATLEDINFVQRTLSFLMLFQG